MAESTKSSDAGVVVNATSSSVSSSFGFTNTTASTKQLLLTKLGLNTNYAVARQDTNNISRTRSENSLTLTNTTTPLIQPELITLRSSEITKVNSYAPIYNPQKGNVPAVHWGVRVDEVLTTVDSEKPLFRIDEPVVWSLMCMNNLSAYITDDLVEQAFLRAVSAFYDENGKFRGGDMMRGAIIPKD